MVKFKKIFKHVLKLLIILALISLVGVIYIFGTFKPSNSKNWEVGFDRLPKINIQGDFVSVTDLRDYHYVGGQLASTNYLNRTFQISHLTRVWFVVEPFVVKPFTGFTGVAHTYFVFDFTDQPPVLISVEARRQKGQKYDAWSGLFNQYELMYVWSTENDQTVRRVVVEDNKLYMYPLQASSQDVQALFVQLAQTTHQLETEPRFYNTLTSNCTNELAKSANNVKPGAIPWNIGLYLPGYATGELYKLGFIPHDQPLGQIENKYYISDLVKELYTQPDFSVQLRKRLDI